MGMGKRAISSERHTVAGLVCHTMAQLGEARNPPLSYCLSPDRLSSFRVTKPQCSIYTDIPECHGGWVSDELGIPSLDVGCLFHGAALQERNMFALALRDTKTRYNYNCLSLDDQ
jgi:hypothetical protein